MTVFAGVASITCTTSRVALAVEGGVEDRVTTHAVVIATRAPTSPEVRCSGTLISSNVVLTVRHCIAPFPNPAKCSAQFGAPSITPSDLWVDARPESGPSTSWTQVESWVIPEPTSICGNDIALLILGRPLASATPATPILTAAEFERATQTGVFGIAGYGATTPEGLDSGLRRSRFGIPIRCVPASPGATYLCVGSPDLMDRAEFTGGDGACVGDSGAGAMASSNHETIFGVLSRGEVDLSRCGGAIFVRTDAWAWLLARTVVDATPPDTRAPAWASALFPAAPRDGDFCRGEGSCAAGSVCTSLDGRRSYVCAKKCDADLGCSTNMHCESSVCVAGARAEDPPAACSATHSRASGRGAWTCVLSVLGLVTLLRVVSSRRDRFDRGRASSPATPPAQWWRSP